MLTAMGTMLGGRVKYYRGRLGLTMAELGAAIGKGHSYISQVEAEKLVPSADVLADLAIALGVSADTLLGLEGASGIPDPELMDVDVNLKVIKKLSPEEARDLAEYIATVKRRVERQYRKQRS